MDRAVSRRRRRAGPAAGRWLLAGCDLSLGNLSARATDEWTHTYPLTAGGEVRIVNTNGRIDVEGVDGIDGRGPGRADRQGRDRGGGASELLPRIVIKEDVKPDRVIARDRAHERHHDRRRLRGPVSRARAEERRSST